MPNIYDGTDDELAYGQALVLLASARGIFPNEEVQREVVAAIQREHDLVPPPPDVLVTPLDARDATLRQQDEELALLRAELARRNKRDEALKANEDEIAALRAQLGETPPAPVAVPVVPESGEVAAPVSSDQLAAVTAQLAQLTAFLEAHRPAPTPDQPAPAAPAVDPRDAELAGRTTP